MTLTPEEALAQLNIFFAAEKRNVSLPLGSHETVKETSRDILAKAMVKCTKKWGSPKYTGPVKGAKFDHDLHRHIQWSMGGAWHLSWWETPKTYVVLLAKSYDTGEHEICIDTFDKK